MAAYKNFVLTNQGIGLLADLMNGNGEMEFRCLAVGSGSHNGGNNIEEMRTMEALREERQRVPFSSINKAEDGFVNLKANVTNEGLVSGYPMTEAGIYAGKKGEQEEILYCVSIVDKPDYMPDFSSKQIYNVIFKMMISIGDVSSATISYRTDVYALAADLQMEKDRAEVAECQLWKKITTESERATEAEEQLKKELDTETDRAAKAEEQLKKELDTEIDRAGEAEEQLGKDIAAEVSRAGAAEEQLKKEIDAEVARASGAEDELQRRKLDVDGDASDVTVKFSEAEQLKPLKSLDKLSEILGVSAKAVSSLIAHLADMNNPHKVSRKQLNVDKTDNTSDMDKPVSTAQQAALDSQYQQLTAYVGQKIADLVNGAPAALDTLKELADAIASHKSIMDALDTAIGKKANEAEFDSHVKDTTKHITATERTNWNDANSKKHTHSNKSVLDGITSTIIDGWNSAVTHITDAVKHITAAERDKWNNGSHNYGTCSTAAATAAKTVSCDGFKLATGAAIAVKFTVTNTAANPTLNVNNTGAKAIYYRGAAITAGYLAANRTYTFRYNGTQYDLVGDIDTNATYTAASAAPKAPGTAAVGSSTKYAREDHVHPLQTSVSGNSGTASKLETARNYNGMSVDGSADRFNYGTCTTAAGTAAKVVACTGFALATGSEITVKFTVTNTAANPTLNVNSTGAKAIYYRGAAITAGYLAANRTYTFRYNGTQWDLVGDINTNTTYGAATQSAAGLLSAADKKKLDGIPSDTREQIDAVNTDLNKVFYPYDSLNNVRLYGFVSKKQMDITGEPNRYIVFVPTMMFAPHVYGVKTIKDIIVQGVVVLRQNGVDVAGYQATNAEQTHQGIILSFISSSDTPDISGHLCCCVFDFYMLE